LEFDVYDGTSMSAPHVAGLAALLKQMHHDWTPMMIKSALMTTGYDVLDGPSTDPTVIFSQGAGHVQPNKAVDPGLVYDSGYYDWLAFLCGTTTGVDPADCSTLAGLGYSLIPSDFNGASIAIGGLPGLQTVSRTVTSVSFQTETYAFSYTGLAGITVTPSVASFKIKPHESKTYSVTFTNNSAALNNYVGGSISWKSNKGHVVRIPVVLNPVALGAPTQASNDYNVTFGYTGSFTATPRGLVAATTFTHPINDGDFVCDSVVVPAGTTYARFSLFNSTTTAGSDLDLYVFTNAAYIDPSGLPIGSSAGGSSDEEVNLLNPAADTYWGCVNGFATFNPSTFTMFAWVLDNADAGNMTVSAPSSALIGTTGLIDLTFSGGLTSGTKYLGSIVYGGTTGMPNPTIIRYDAP
jgi:hypothetical protein